MFLLDSLMISGIRWAIETTITAAEAEMNDDTALREQLLAAEMSREMGEISDQDFREVEADLLARIREIKQRREGGAGPLAFGGAQPMETSADSTFQIEASVSGDFYDPADAPHTTVVEQSSPRDAAGSLVHTESGQAVEVLDMEPGDAAGRPAPALPLRAPQRTKSSATGRRPSSKADRAAASARRRVVPPRRSRRP
jgi:hypothetical protein